MALLAGCSSLPVASATAVTSPAVMPVASSTATVVFSSSATLPPPATATPTASVQELETHFCEPAYQLVPGHFLLMPPIGREANQEIDSSYRYGSTANGRLEVHHGVEFVNGGGTPVLAAADGVVVFVGDDNTALIAAWPRFYGNLVVIEHALAGLAQPVFTLYGHLSEVGIAAGARVAAGDEIGRVGATGVALGNHLHFEVRVGKNSYADTRNPELWLELPEGSGALAVYILDANGEPISGLPLVITPLGDSSPGRIFLEAYGKGVNGDDVWAEQYAASGLPAGRYEVAFTYGRPYRTAVEVQAGQLTIVPFCLSPSP